MDNLNLGGMPDWDALAAELANETCAHCGEQATTRCVGVRADSSCGLVMYLCDGCRVEFMTFIASGGKVGIMADYDAVLYRQRCVN